MYQTVVNGFELMGLSELLVVGRKRIYVQTNKKSLSSITNKGQSRRWQSMSSRLQSLSAPCLSFPSGSITLRLKIQIPYVALQALHDLVPILLLISLHVAFLLVCFIRVSLSLLWTDQAHSYYKVTVLKVASGHEVPPLALTLLSKVKCPFLRQDFLNKIAPPLVIF